MSTKKSAAPKTPAPSKKTAVKLPEKLTMTTMVAYISEKHEISKKQVREITEDIFDIMAAGALRGERVPVGKIGKLFVRVKPATKARKGRNPLTGEEMTIPAKKATKVPKFTFLKAFKEEALKAKVK